MKRHKHSPYLSAFKGGKLSLGQLASKFKMNKHQALELIGE